MTTSLTPSDHLNSEPLVLDKNAIVAFASRFDPQPYHLDAEAAEQSIFGGLCASGWHIAALATRLVSETLLQNGHPCVEMISVSQMKWSHPIFNCFFLYFILICTIKNQFFHWIVNL